MGIYCPWLNNIILRERRAAMNHLNVQERLVALKQREVQQAHLRREAGLSSSDLLARAVQSLINFLAVNRVRRQGHHSLSRQSY
jgi:hypothetical protein